jgi:hypothetical protein
MNWSKPGDHIPTTILKSAISCRKVDPSRLQTKKASETKLCKTNSEGSLAHTCLWRILLAACAHEAVHALKVHGVVSVLPEHQGEADTVELANHLLRRQESPTVNLLALELLSHALRLQAKTTHAHSKFVTI